MDDDLVTVGSMDRYDFEQVPGAVRAEVQHLAIVVFPRRERVLDRMNDVGVGDAMLRAEW